jgi:RES domain.
MPSSRWWGPSGRICSIRRITAPRSASAPSGGGGGGAEGAEGILYPSARAPDGLCVALFWPDVAGAPAQGDHFAFEWDGSRVSRIHNLATGALHAL